MAPVDDSLISSPERFLNREISWLAFNARVLAQAEDDGLPLLERLKFCAIYDSNLDEFFQVRVAGLKEQVAAGVSRPAPDGLSPLAQLAAIRDEIEIQAWRLEYLHDDVVVPALAAHGIDILDVDDLVDPNDRKRLRHEFENRIFPILTPLAVDPSHPFPYISNLSLNLAVLVNDGEQRGHRFARLKVPPSLPRFIELGDDRWVPVEQVIMAHLDQLFPGMEIIGGWPFRVTRNADMMFDDEDADDLLETIEVELRRRRFGRAIRLQLDHAMPEEARQLLTRELDLEAEDVYLHQGLIDLSGYWQLVDLDRPDLKLEPDAAVVPRRLQDLEDSRDLFARIRQADILVHHPYESFSSSVSEFIHQASLDPAVQAIKLTLYRTSGDSPIIEALIRAAELGKQVAALVELRARFDEEANINWARRLEEAGVHVVYGLVGLKIHTKTALVVRAEGDGIRRYCHIGTGNYNPKTARIYEDLGILTAEPAVGDDLTQLFNYLTGYGRDVSYERLLVAPHSLRGPLEELIENEMTAPAGTGRIVMKMNSLVDPDLIDRLYAASRAGVAVDLIVRGICCLRAGVPGLSDNIAVRSLVGRYLEHSRVYCFGNGGGQGIPAYYIGSADLMPRNLDRRVEVVARVDDVASQERLAEILTTNLDDTALSWELREDDVYHRIGGDRSAHEELARLADSRAHPPEPRAPLLRRPPSPPVRFALDGASGREAAGLDRRSDRGPSTIAPFPRTGPEPGSLTHSRLGGGSAPAPGPRVPAAGVEPSSPARPADTDRPAAPTAEADTEPTASADTTAGARGDAALFELLEPAPARDRGESVIRAAGCVLYRRDPSGVEVLVVHRPRYDDWSFPKGKCEAGETELETARRELMEETGFEGEVELELPTARYEVDGQPKTVRYWLLSLTGGRFRVNDEVDRIRWLTVDEARLLLSYDHDRELLRSVPADAPRSRPSAVDRPASPGQA